MTFPPWRELKQVEEILLEHRAAGDSVPRLVETLRRLIAEVEGSPDAEQAICFHGALALVYVPWHARIRVIVPGL
jgi:hypothetical protein